MAEQDNNSQNQDPNAVNRPGPNSANGGPVNSPPSGLPPKLPNGAPLPPKFPPKLPPKLTPQGPAPIPGTGAAPVPSAPVPSAPNRPQMSNIPPHNAPQQPNKIEITEEDKFRISRFNDENAAIIRQVKKIRKGRLTKNARHLVKVRRLYSAKIPRNLFSQPMSGIRDLRSKFSSAGKSKLINAGAKKARNIITTFLIIFIILAVVGTGTLVTWLVLTKDDIGVPEGTIDIANKTQLQVPIDDYVMGDEQPYNGAIINNTTATMYIRFYFKIEGTSFTKDWLADGRLKLSDLEVLISIPEDQKSNWYEREVTDSATGYTYKEYYYKGSVNPGGSLDTLNGFAIASSPSVQSDWAGKPIELSYCVDGMQVGTPESDMLKKGWPQEWIDLMQN